VRAKARFQTAAAVVDGLPRNLSPRAPSPAVMQLIRAFYQPDVLRDADGSSTICSQ
jgi:hypothetical protein